MKKQIIFMVWISLLITLKSNGIEKNSTVESLVKKYFITFHKPLRFTGQILLKTDQNFTSYEILEIQNFVDSVNSIIPIIKILPVPLEKGSAYNPNENRIVVIKGKNSLAPDRNLDLRNSFSMGRISSINVFLSFPESAESTERQKIIRYNILRSLVVYKSSNRLQKLIPGSVFAETDHSKITYNPVDFQILQEIYSSKYNYEKNDVKLFRTKEFNFRKYLKLFESFAQITSLLFALILLTWFYQKGAFKNHRYDFGDYFTQGLTGFLIVSSFVILLILLMIVRELIFNELVPVNTPFSSIVKSLPLFLGYLLGGFIFTIASIIIQYFIEKRFLAENENYSLSIVIPFLTTSIVPVSLLAILALLLMGFSKNKDGAIILLVFAILIFAIMVAIVRTLFIILNREGENKLRKKDLEIARMGELTKQAELQSLRAKINPHFLYNSLNSIAGLAHTNPEKTEAMALKLSDFFKYAINREQKQINSLQEELNAIQTYLEIEKVRFGSRLHFEILCPESLLNVQIPQLIIQPLVENAIKHGTSKITGDGFVKIEIKQDRWYINIRISDNGPAFPDGPITGYGLKNTIERLNLAYGKWAKFRWQNGEPKFVELVVPMKKW